LFTGFANFVDVVNSNCRHAKAYIPGKYPVDFVEMFRKCCAWIWIWRPCSLHEGVMSTAWIRNYLFTNRSCRFILC